MRQVLFTHQHRINDQGFHQRLSAYQSLALPDPTQGNNFIALVYAQPLEGN